MTRRGKLWFGSGALRVALVLAMAQLLSFPQNVHCQTSDSVFCERFAIPFGYKCREYTTLTTDGYVLVMHRISNQPRTTSQHRRESTTAESPAPFPPLCVSTAEQPFETIHDYVRGVGELQSSNGATCSPAPTQAPPLPVSHNETVDDSNLEIKDKKTVEPLEPDHTSMSTTFPNSAGSRTQPGEGIDENELHENHHSSSGNQRLVPDRNRNFTSLDLTMTTVFNLSTMGPSRTDFDSDHEPAMGRQSFIPADTSTTGIPRSISSVASVVHKPSVDSKFPRTASTTGPAATWKSSPITSILTKSHHGHQGHSTVTLAHSTPVTSRRIPAAAWRSTLPSSRIQRKHHRHHHDSTTATQARRNLMSKTVVSPFRDTINDKFTDLETGRLPEPELDSVGPAPQPESNVDENSIPIIPVSHSPQPPAQPPLSSQGPQGGGEPVLLMHQEFQNGESWFEKTDDDSDQLLPHLLLNAGFDVWIGHQRATYYGHDHVTFAPDNPSYWNWTWDEHAAFDMPALLDLVYIETGSAVNFVGISQSATAGAAAATMPSVSSVLRSLTLIGPTMYRGNTTSRTLLDWASLLPGSNIGRAYYNTAFQDGVFNLTSEFPTNALFASPISAAASDISGPNCCLGSTVMKFDNGWDGTTSMKNLLHYQQDIRTNIWSHFDYGSVQNNSKAYNGSPLPPTYNPEDIPQTLPVLVIYGGQDRLAPASGSLEFMSRLKSPIGAKSAEFLPEYAHFDLFYSLNRTQDVFIPVLQFLERQRQLQ